MAELLTVGSPTSQPKHQAQNEIISHPNIHKISNPSYFSRRLLGSTTSLGVEEISGRLGSESVVVKSWGKTRRCNSGDYWSVRRRNHGEDVPGVSAPLPSHVLVHPLPCSSGQPRRTYIQVVSRESRSCISVQLGGERWLWTCRGTSSSDRSARRR